VIQWGEVLLLLSYRSQPLGERSRSCHSMCGGRALVVRWLCGGCSLLCAAVVGPRARGRRQRQGGGPTWWEGPQVWQSCAPPGRLAAPAPGPAPTPTPTALRRETGLTWRAGSCLPQWTARTPKRGPGAHSAPPGALHWLSVLAELYHLDTWKVSPDPAGHVACGRERRRKKVGGSKGAKKEKKPGHLFIYLFIFCRCMRVDLSSVLLSGWPEAEVSAELRPASWHACTAPCICCTPCGPWPRGEGPASPVRHRSRGEDELLGPPGLCRAAAAVVRWFLVGVGVSSAGLVKGNAQCLHYPRLLSLLSTTCSALAESDTSLSQQLWSSPAPVAPKRP